MARFVWTLTVGASAVRLYVCTVCYMDFMNGTDLVNINVESL